MVETPPPASERGSVYVCMYVFTIKSNPHTAWRLPLVWWCTLSNVVFFQIDWGRGQRFKSAQGAIKILMKSDFSSDSTHFLTTIGGLSPTLGTQSKMGGGGSSTPKRYKVTPLEQIMPSLEGCRLPPLHTVLAVLFESVLSEWCTSWLAAPAQVLCFLFTIQPELWSLD